MDTILKMYKIRYHLQNGPHKYHWQIKKEKEKFYINPKNTTIIIHNCFLYNNKRIADKIYLGANKNVCAWISFDKLNILQEKIDLDSFIHIEYNPKKLPYWHMKNSDKNIDFMGFEILYLCEKGVFAPTDKLKIYSLGKEVVTGKGVYS